MKTGIKAKVVSAVLATTIAMSSLASAVPFNAFADGVPIVTIGADLNQEQQDKVMSFFGVDKGAVDVVFINNQMERQYLEGKIPDEVIGTRTISCSYTMPTVSGGIVVKTANLNWVSDGMLANALLTSGIENCQVLATAPFEVSGTGALTGVLVAYEKSSGEELDEEKKQLATEELIVTGDIIEELKNEGYVASPENGTIGETGTGTGDPTDPTGNTYGQITETQILALLNDIKIAVINGEMSEDKIKEIVDARLKEYGVQLTEETYNRLVNYLMSLTQLDYGEKFKESLSGLTDRITKGFDINLDVNLNIDFKTDKGSLAQFWENILNFFKWLFSFGNSDSDTDKKSEDAPVSIFDTVDTNVIQYDEPVGDEPESNESEEESSNDDLGGTPVEPADTPEINDTQETPDTPETPVENNADTDTLDDVLDGGSDEAVPAYGAAYGNGGQSLDDILAQ